MESFAEALTRSEKLDAAAVRGYALHNIGTVYQQRGAYEEAQTHFEHALAAYRSVDDAGGITLVLNATGKLHNVRGRYTDARAALYK
ncbi:MAG: tetratricopeptide (TPR) repeat protein [Candidatus Latescibacterota bacterium]|jgi:tetratricopeptide (TPR) repeat protein